MSIVITKLFYIFIRPVNSFCRPSADFSGIDTDRLEYQPIWGQYAYLRRDVRTIRFHSSMEGMFLWCDALREPDLSGWDVSRASTFSGFMDDGMTINGRPWKEFLR